MSEGLSTNSRFSSLPSFSTTTSTTTTSAAPTDAATANGGRAITLDHRHAGQNPIALPESLSAGFANHGDYNMKSEDIEAEGRPPYLHAMLAGGIGGSTGDMLMHSLDTVKTRQQGDPNMPPKYTSLARSYQTIWRQEGISRGLYGGWIPALGGSFPGTVLFFGSYEWTKRFLIDHGVQQHIAYLSAGFVGDLAASVVYVPSEVLKTRLQLQGRYNNPHFASGYNYRGTLDAARTIVRTEGPSALFYGYKATLYRDLPFSAFQFMFWEQFTAWARKYKQSRDIGMPLEMLTGGAAGGLAGVLTCPLDVVKTRLQTQINTPTAEPEPATRHAKDPSPQKRSISTSSPSTHRPQPGATPLRTSSVITGLRVIYHTEGLGGWFRGVGPRGVWTFIQSGCMLFLYQRLVRQLDVWMPLEREEL
ncbi:Mitochondrial magnesium exporter 1 [Cladobotryum mycophilum]|uniref:Mitochondrial magnesium exporter 1 n=1 Tax=Cladobotryum mycophilum TaxID=491253 RepID=A0ABR0S6X8_9HYPO